MKYSKIVRVYEDKKHFKEVHNKIFKDVAGDLLVKLGYETNNDW
jgi:hypothetical protein